MNHYYMPFGMGPRICAGQNVSILEMSKMIPQILRTFSFELDDALKHGEWKTTNRWLVKQWGFNCRVRLREGGGVW
jgi:cytochrome P450